jgi:hypothetical protein
VLAYCEANDDHNNFVCRVRFDVAEAEGSHGHNSPVERHDVSVDDDKCGSMSREEVGVALFAKEHLPLFGFRWTCCCPF